MLYSDCIIFGGSEKVLVNILNNRELNEKFDFTFAFAKHKGYKPGNRIGGAVKLLPVRILSKENIIHDFREQIPPHYLALVEIVLQVVQKVLFSIYNCCALFLLFLIERPSILHINNGGYPGAQSCRLAVVAAKLAGVRRIVFGVNNLASPPRNIIDQVYDRIIQSSVNVFITASKAACNHLVSIRHFEDSKAVNIPNTLLNDYREIVISPRLRMEFNLDPGSIVVGCAGILTERKGFHILAAAMGEIREEAIRRCIKVYVFGEGEMRGQLEEIVIRSRIDQIMFLPGYKEDIVNYIIDCDMCVLPSIAFEDCPYSNLEAMLLGKPIISTPIAGIAEQVEPNVNGCLVSPNNIDELADAIMLLSSDEELRMKMGRNSKKLYWERFNYGNTVHRYNKLYSDLVGVKDAGNRAN